MIEKLSGFFLSKWFSWDITLLLECILYFAKTFCKVRNESDEDRGSGVRWRRHLTGFGGDSLQW